MVFYDSKYKRRRYLRAFSVIFALVMVGSAVSMAAGVFLVLNKKSSRAPVDIAKSYEFYKTPLNSKKISLTFDDGPHPVYTRAVAAILKKHNVPATFFFVGENVLKHPGIAREISLEGFEIGNHTFTHSPAVHSSAERLNDELRLTGEVIEITTDRPPLFYRPPFLLDIGDDPTVNPDPETGPKEPLLVALEDGYISVGADIDSKDWLVSSPGELMQNVVNSSNTGHIVLLHDGGHGHDTDYMLAVLEKMIVGLKEQGYEFVPLRDLLFPPAAIDLASGLRAGSTDAATLNQVSLLQWFLYTENFFDLASMRGVFDSKTEEALINWQKKNEAENPGVQLAAEYGTVGENTQKAIAASYAQNMAGRLAPPAAAAPDTSAANRLQRINLTGIAMIFSASEYLLWLVIVLVFVRLFSLLAIYLFSLVKNQGQRPKNLTPYRRGVSVLIPAHNEEENIESSVLSVLRNDYRNKEIIVINDGSTDTTQEVVESVQARYPGQVKLVNIKNGGKANALNIGISFAKYELFIAMDADTVFTPDTIGNLTKHFSDKSVGAVAGKVETARSNNLLDIFQSIEYTVGQNIEKKVLSSINAVGVVPGPIGAWRKSAVVEAGGYSNETLVEDQDMTLSVLIRGFRIIYEPAAVAYTETPHTLRDFLKQRFRWIYGTFQCAWKHKAHLFERSASSFGLVIMPNILLFSLIAPLFFPLVDALLLFALFFGSWQKALLMYGIFTAVDVLYSSLAFMRERKNWKKLLFIPIQRLYYRQILYYVVVRSVLRAIEGTEEFWNKVVKNGESQKYYFSNFEKVIASKN